MSYVPFCTSFVDHPVIALTLTNVGLLDEQLERSTVPEQRARAGTL
jgi:hypothetical protein